MSGIKRSRSPLNERLQEIEHSLNDLRALQIDLRRVLVSQERRRPLRVAHLMSYYGSDFIEACYINLLGRVPDQQGKEHFLAQMRGGRPRRSILIDLYRSAEARRLGVKIGGISLLISRSHVHDLLKAIAGKPSIEPGRKIFVDARELLSLDSTELVIECYRRLLGREPDSVGLKHYLTRLDRGAAKSRIVGDLGYSLEARRRRVQVNGLRWRYFLSGAFSS